ncbi:MAG: peptide deformylase [Gammaproteobacteria bacterium]|nr:peptide deformylase [Gammaproteobacteria bacterium]
MALLKILHYPDPKLRRIAAPVTQVDANIRTLVDDMLDTMYAAPGIGLAATQVDIAQRVIVIDISEDKNAPLVLINPEILSGEGSIKVEEGCLSVPSIYEPVARYSSITYRALNRDGQPFEGQAHDLLAVCIQHENDHLDGKLFVDYLSEMKRQRIKRKMEKHLRETM